MKVIPYPRDKGKETKLCQMSSPLDYRWVGEKCWFLTNAPCSSLYLATCTLCFVLMKHPPNQMICGAMSCRGAAGLFSLRLTPLGMDPRARNAQRAEHINVHGCTIFSQDGAPCRRNPLRPLCMLLFSINSKGSFICTIPERV